MKSVQGGGENVVGAGGDTLDQVGGKYGDGQGDEGEEVVVGDLIDLGLGASGGVGQGQGVIGEVSAADKVVERIRTFRGQV